MFRLWGIQKTVSRSGQKSYAYLSAFLIQLRINRSNERIFELLIVSTETVTIVPSKMLLPCISNGKTSRDKGIVTVSVQTTINQGDIILMPSDCFGSLLSCGRFFTHELLIFLRFLKILRKFCNIDHN